MDNLKHCQSCGMPMTEAEHFGKNTDESKNEDYCCHCYPDGAFPGECTMEEMIDICVPIIVEHGTCPDETSARKMLSEFLPTLKRWKKQGMINTYKLKDGVSEVDFLAAFDEMHSKYLSKCKGYINCQLMRMGDMWTDWTIWETMADANNAMMQSEGNEAAIKFFPFIGELVEQNLYPLERSY